MAYDQGLAERLRVLLDGRRGVTEKAMFGGVARWVELAYAHVATLAAKKAPAKRAKATVKPKAKRKK